MVRIISFFMVVANLVAMPAFAQYVVNSDGDAPRSASAGAGECDTGNVVPAPDAGFEPECTLRAAIETANLVDSGSLAAITFAGHIPVSGGVTVIAPAIALPDIETPVHIDGTSHPAYEPSSGTPRVSLVGTSLTENAHGLRITANGSFSQIVSLNIHSFPVGAGIQITSAGNVLVSQCHIGVFAGTSVSAANNWGVRISSGNDNIIGGSSQLPPPIGPWPNVISGNTSTGVQISGDDNILGRNHIGVSPAGDEVVGNGGMGVSVLSGSGNQIGSGQGENVIAGNQGRQIQVIQSAGGATVQCSRIGTNAAGDAVLFGSAEPAVEILGNGHQIGSTTCPTVIAGGVRMGVAGQVSVPASFNTIEHLHVGTNPDRGVLQNEDNGIFVVNGEGNQIRHNTVGNGLTGIGLGVDTVNNFVRSNHVGVHPDGTALPLLIQGIRDSGNGNGNIIGGDAAQGNVIGNTASGIQLSSGSSSSLVQGNLIGTTESGDPAPVENGILVAGSDHQVGGTGAGIGNRIGQASSSGIRLASVASGIEVVGNRIGTESILGGFPNDAIGIHVDGESHHIGGFNSIGGMAVGIRVFSGSHTIEDNYIGVDDAYNPFPISTHGIRLSNGSSNVRVSGNSIGYSTRGIRINSDSPGAVIGNNWIGVTPNGDDMGNSLYGLYTNGPGARIGTDPVTSESMPNVVGFNGSSGGMRIGGSNTLVINNFIGFTPEQTQAPNGGSGGLIILDAPDNVDVGLSSEANANLIGANTGHGIDIRSAGSDVTIGVNDIGVRHVGNGGHGIFVGEGVADLAIQSSTVSDLGLLKISSNQGHGIAFHPDSGTGNRVRRVEFAFNAGKAIDLGPGGRDQDPGDEDTGPNRLQNFPEFDEAVSGFNADTGQVDMRFRIDSTPSNASYPLAVDIFRAFEGIGGGAGNGVFRYVGTVIYTEDDAQAFVERSLTPDANAPDLGPETWFVASASDQLGNTSELSGRFGGPPRHTIGGVIFNLSGSGLVLQNNGGDDLVISQTGNFSFQFGSSVPDGESYAVTVSQQPSGQVCGVSNGMGIVNGADVTNVQVICDEPGDETFSDRFELEGVPRR